MTTPTPPTGKDEATLTGSAMSTCAWRKSPYWGLFVDNSSREADDCEIEDGSSAGEAICCILCFIGSKTNQLHPKFPREGPFCATVEELNAKTSGYRWGAVLNETTEARGFQYDGDRERHIIYKKLKTIRYAVWFILVDTNDIPIRARYIKTTADIWVDRLSRKINYDDLAFNLRHFNHLDNIWGRHTVHRFPTMENARLPR
eukprot:jgi/Tetstr1/440801/TSEL_029108.t1